MSCSNVDRFIKGAPDWRAFFSSQHLLWAVVFSSLLHAALLSFLLPTRPTALHQARQDIAVRLVYSANQLLKPAPAVAKTIPAVRESMASGAGNGATPVNASTGRRAIWAFQGAGTSPNQQALYQAQQQRQLQLAHQAENQAARGKYESQLIEALKKIQLHAPCQLALSASRKAQLKCDASRDLTTISAVLARSGNPPSAFGDASWLALNLTPAAGGDLKIASEWTLRKFSIAQN